MSPKLGQKLTDKPKDTIVKVRMDRETVEKLDTLVSEQDSDRSKVIRRGIEIQYEERKKIRNWLRGKKQFLISPQFRNGFDE